MSQNGQSGAPTAGVDVLYEDELPGGAMRSFVLRRHHVMRFTDVEGGANVGLLLFNRDHLLERYNMPDTLKAQHTAFLTKGRALYSDMGRVLCSITADTAGWHDTVSGHLDAKGSKAKWGEATYQDKRNAYQRNAHDCFLIELAKWGLTKTDLVPNINLFSKVAADSEGKLHYVAGASKPGSYVDLRAEMNVLVVLNTCPHPFDPSPTYAPRKVTLTVAKTAAPGPDDVCRTSRPENGWAFENTERYFL
jgi:urea carboxylase-associated protein 2